MYLLATRVKPRRMLPSTPVSLVVEGRAVAEARVHDAAHCSGRRDALWLVVDHKTSAAGASRCRGRPRHVKNYPGPP